MIRRVERARSSRSIHKVAPCEILVEYGNFILPRKTNVTLISAEQQINAIYLSHEEHGLYL